MQDPLVSLALLTMLLPLSGSLIAGLLGKRIGRVATHTIAIALVGVAFVLSVYLFWVIVLGNHPSVDGLLYNWAAVGNLRFDMGLLLDRLSVTMSVVVLFVSFMVHIYTVGYMADDPGYQRFFCYVSLFTFAMLTLVFSDNFLLLYFGWEGVGLVSYLLIGFWFTREKANLGSLKAFLVNRVGDFAFLLAIAAVIMYFGSIQYQTVFAAAPTLVGKTMMLWSNQYVQVLPLICALLFIGAMGKSAQVPLHVWLPESMEGPTPISALIHAATMVTAGIYMVSRMSPLFEYAPAILSVILVIGGTTCLLMGFLAVVQFDIKRVIAYSTISQLGYMAVALGASAYDAAIFHLVTHAFFKALLFLGAGSVIVALHHEQDMRKMGGLARFMPITYATFLIGSLAISAIPPFSGFYSKDAIIEAAQLSTLPGAGYAYFCVIVGAFVTPLYTFRALFLTFHAPSRLEPKLLHHVQESPWVILLPLLALAIPSVVAGGILIGPMLYDQTSLLGETVFVLPEHNVLGQLAAHFEGAEHMALTAGKHLTLWLSIAGIITAWLFVAGFPHWAAILKKRFSWVYAMLMNKYGFDAFNHIVFVQGTRDTGEFLYKVTDEKIIDSGVVNGSGRLVRWFAQVARRVQTGYLYHYALSMVVGLLVFLIWFVGGEA